MTLVKITEVTPSARYGLEGQPVNPFTTNCELVRSLGVNEKGQREYLIEVDETNLDDPSHPDPGVPGGWDWITYHTSRVGATHRHYGIIRASYHFVEWVMKNGGGWSLSTKPKDRANFTSREHAAEVLDDIIRVYGGWCSWADDTLTVVPLAEDSVTGELPPLPSFEESTTFVVLRESEVHRDGYSVCVTEYLADDSGGWCLTADLDDHYEFDSFEDAQQAIQGDNYLVVVPIAPKPLSPAAIASAEKLVSKLLQSSKPKSNDRPCQCGSGEPWVSCTAESTYCG